MVWGAPLAGTLAVAIAITLFFGTGAPMIRGVDPVWASYGLIAILVASGPALWYLRGYKATLDDDAAAARSRAGAPDPQRREELLRKRPIGGALCGLPLALGAIYLLSGGEKRGFVAAAGVSVALRLSYRPFGR